MFNFKKEEKNDGVFKMYTNFKQTISSVLFSVDGIFDLIEKIKKLLNWED